MTGSKVVITAEAVQALREFERFRAEATGKLRKVSEEGTILGNVIATVGASLSVAALTGWVKGAIDAADATGKLSQQTGIAAKDIAGLQLAYQQAGLSSEQLQATQSRLSKSIAEGNKAFEALDIKTTSSTGALRSNQEVLEELADRFADLPDGPRKTALAMELFGKAGAEIIPLLNGGAEGFRQMAAEAKALGLVIDDQTAADAERFNDTLDTLGAVSAGAARTIAAQLLPQLAELVTWAREAIDTGAVREWAVSVANAVSTVAGLLEPAAMIATGYFGIFVAAPAVLTAVSAALTGVYGAVGAVTAASLSGAGAVGALNTALFGTAVAANAAKGGLYTLNTAANLLFAAFAGWQIGSYLRENFAEARIAGLSLVGVLMKGWENVKYGAAVAWEGVKFAFDTQVNGMRKSFAGFLEVVGKGLQLAGFSDASKGVLDYAAGVKAAADQQKTFEERTAALTAEHRASIKTIDQNITELVGLELAAASAGKAEKSAAEGKKAIRILSEEQRAAIKKEAEAYANLTNSLAEKIELNNAEINGGKALAESDKLLIKLNSDLAAGVLRLTPAHEANVRAQIKQISAQEDLMASQRRAKDGLEAVNKLLLEQDAERRKAVEDAEREASANEELARTYGLTKAAIEADEVARLEQQLAQRASTGLTIEEIEQLEKLIAVKKRNAAALSDIDAKNAMKKSNDDMLASFKRTSDEMRESLTDALMRGFESGKGFGRNLVETIKNMFGTLVLRPIISAVVNPVANSLTNSAGLSGATTAANSLGNGAGIIGAIGSVGIGAAQTAGALLTGQIGFGSTLSAGLSAIGTGSMSGIMAGLSSVVGVLGPIALGIGAIAKMLDKGPEQNTRLTFTSNNTPGNISINERGNEGRVNQSYIDGYSTGAFGSFGLSSTFWMDGRQPAVQNFIQNMTKLDDTLAQFLTAAERANVTAAVTGKSFTANTGAEGSDPTAALESVLVGRLNAIMDGVQPGLSALTAGFKGTSDQLATEVQTLLAYRRALADTGEAVMGVKWSLEQMAAMARPGETAGAAVARVSGMLTAYMQNYATEAERLAPVQKAIADVFASLNVAAPTTRQEFAALVERFSPLKAETRGAWDQLMSIQGAFAELHPVLAESAKATDAVTEAVKTAAQTQRESLQDQLAQMTMTEKQYARSKVDPSNIDIYDQISAIQDRKKAAEDLAVTNKVLEDQLRELDRASMTMEAIRLQDIEGMSASTIELYDLVAARTQAKQAADNLASVNKGLQEQIDAFIRSGLTAAELRAEEVKGMDASTLALYERLEGLKAERAASEKAAADKAAAEAKAQSDQQAMFDRWAAMNSAMWKSSSATAGAIEQVTTESQDRSLEIARSRGELEIELYNLTHTKAEQLAEARRRELLAMDESLRPLLAQIHAQQDLAAAAEESARRVEAAASQRAGLDRQFYQLTGNTVKLRELELAALEPSNRARQQEIWAVQDRIAEEQAAAQAQAAIAQAMASAAEEQRRAAEQAKSAWQDLADSIFEEFKRINGLIIARPAALADANSQFAIATAQARTGDQAAAKLLPSLSQAVLELAEESATTSAELRLIRAQTALSLYQTGTFLGGKFALHVPSYDVGTNYVPQTGLALVHQGERITPAAYNNAFTPDAGPSYMQVVEELRYMRKENAELARKLDVALYAIAKNTGEAVSILDAAQNGETPFQVEVAA